MFKRRGFSDLGTSAATVFAMVPGFIFPFLLTLRLSAQESDTLLLAMSITTTLISVMGTAIELNTISEFGRHLNNAERPGPHVMRSYLRRIQLFGFSAVAVIGVALTTLYSLSMSDWAPEFVIVCAVMLGAPVVAIYSSLDSGMLIGAGKAVVSVASQAFRPVPPILLILVCPEAPLVLYAVAFGLGELGRWLFLRHQRKRALTGSDPVGTDELETRGMVWQATSASVTQGSPAIDRVFMSSAPAGAVSTYELASKILFAAVQFLNYGFLVRRVGKWSRIPKLSPADGRNMLKRDLTVLVGMAAALTVLGIAALYSLSFLPLPELWITSSRWAMVLLVAAPMMVWNSAVARLLTIARKQHYLLWFSLLTVSATLVSNIILFSIFGAFGIVLAMLCARFLSTVAYSIVFRVLLTRLAEAPEAP